MTKRKYLTISEGYSARDAEPIFATSDPYVIRIVAREISKRLGGEQRKTTNQNLAGDQPRG
jgi:hypothetical protein